MAYQAAGSIFSRIGGALGLAFKFKIFAIFLVFLLINAVTIAVQERSLTPAIQDLGIRFTTPTQKLHQEVNIILEKGVIYERTPHFWGGIWKLITVYWSLLTNLYIIILWISILGFFSRHLILWDDSKRSSGVLIGFILFIGIQMLLIGITQKGTIWDPIIAFRDFGKAIPHLIRPFKTATEGLQEELTNTCVNETCDV
jgi:hypothetical protein